MELLFSLIVGVLLIAYAHVLSLGGGLCLVVGELIAMIFPGLVGGIFGARRWFGLEPLLFLGIAAKTTVGLLVGLFGLVLVLQLF